MAFKAAILGASGYTGGELLRLLALHPEMEVVYASSREYRGKPIHYAHPALQGYYRGLRYQDLSLEAILSVEPDIVFNALPHTVGAALTGELYDAGLTIVDLSADYRLASLEEYEKWYGEHPRPDLLGKSVYGLPELHREELRGAKLIAAPGCNATAAILAAAPLALLPGVEWFIVDVKVGSSEHGSKPARGTHHPEREGSARPYSGEGHRHEAEAEQELSRLASHRVRVSLVPHAVPLTRGALASAHTLPGEPVDVQSVSRAYSRFYRGARFVRIARFGPLKYPDVKNVVGSNYADVGYAVDSRTGRVSGFAAIDNLVRGAAGQAIQSLNIALGLPEDLGLSMPPLRP